MNKIIFKIFVAVICVCIFSAEAKAAAAEDSKIFTPYFNMTLAEGLYIPSQGEFFSGGAIDTEVGLLAKISPKHSVFGLYNLNYQGPTFQPQDGKQFQERSLDHAFNFEYRYILNQSFRLRPGFSYTKGFRRSGANEAWETGLYNMNSSGGQLAVDYNFSMLEKNAMLTGQYLLRKLTFPNYTDLLSEFQEADADAEISGGKQDQNMNQISISGNWNNFSLGISYSIMNYVNQTVVETNGVYGTTKQKDKSTTFDFGFDHKFWVLHAYPAVEYTLYRSNQNFLRFKYFGATMGTLTDPSADVTLIEDSYSYNELGLKVPVDIYLMAKWALSGGIDLTYRTYTSRPPRDPDNNYLGGKQKNTLTKLYFGFKKRLNDISNVNITYAFIVATSNNKFEKYLPYNYTGQNIGIAYQLTF